MPVIAIVAMVVIDAVANPDTTPVALRNPFVDAHLPQTSSGTADGLAHAVATEKTQAVKAVDAAAVDRLAPDLPGAVGTTTATTVFRRAEPGGTPVPPPGGRGGPTPAVTAPARSASPAPSASPAGFAATFGASKLVAPDRSGIRRDGTAQVGRVELPERRTAAAQVFHNPDGTFTTEQSLGTERFRDAKGAWVGVDTALTEATGGRLRSRATEHPVEVAAAASDPQVGRIQLGAGMSFGFGVDDAASSARAQVEGSKATFASVRDSADLQLGPTADGLKEVIVLRSADAPSTWTFPLALTGLTARVDGDRVLLADGAGTVRAAIPPGWMEDSRATGGLHATSRGVTYRLVTTKDGGQALQVDLDRAWLADPERVYPVNVDPTVTTLLTGADDTYVSSAHPQTNYADDVTIRAGVFGSDVVRGYLSFPGQPGLTGAHVVNAHVKIVNWDSAGGCTPYPAYLRKVTIPWYGGNMTWPGATLGPVVAEATFARDGDLAGCPAAWVTMGDSDTRLRDLVNTWTHDANANFGLALTASETDGAALKAYYSNNCWCNPADPPSDLRPKLEIEWSSYGAEYSYPNGVPQWSTPLTQTTPGTMTVRVKNTGQNAWPANSNYKLAYHVYQNGTLYDQDGAETNLPTTVNPGASIDLPANVDPLPAGSYDIRWDMKEAGVSWFSSQGIDYLSMPLTVSTTAPIVTGIYPANNAAVSTLRPALTLVGTDPDNAPNPLTYSFQLCTGADAASGTCWTSGFQAGSTWQPPPGALTWGTAYHWRGRVSDGANQSAWTDPIGLYPELDQPPVQSQLGNDPYVPPVAQVHPLAQNYVATVTDASLAAVGPGLALDRTYNSRNDANGLFGTGWTSSFDMASEPDPAGAGNLLVSYPDGRITRFGRNGDGSFEPPHGQYALLQAPAAKVASFTAANSTTSLGSADTGESWQLLDGTWGISDNNAYLISGSIWQRNAAVMPAAADGTLRFTVPVAQDGVGVAFRVQDIDNMWMLYVKPSTNSLVLAKRVGGSETQVATIANACCTASDTYAVTMSGGLLSVLRNNRVVGSASDTAFSTATRAGLYVASAGSGRIGSLVMTDDQHRDQVTRANSATSLGATETGEAWQSTSGTWGVDGNAAYLATAAGTRNAATVVGAADGAFSFTMPVAQAGVGLVFRSADANNFWRLVAQPGSNSWQLIKRDDGVETTVATAAGMCCTAADVLRVETNGPQISVLRNGTQILSANDPAVLYGTRVGPFAETTGAGRIDNMIFTAATTLTEKAGNSYAFRSDGRLAKITDVSGRQVVLTYDGDARLTSATNQTSGRAITFAWSGGHISSASTASVAAYGGPLTWTYAYSGDKLTSVTAPHTSTPTTYAYTAGGRLSQVTLPRGTIDTKIGYNTDGTVAWREDGRGKRTTYAVLTSGTTTTIRITDPKGHPTDWDYHNGQLVAHRDGSDERTFSYNDRGFLSQIRDENGNLLRLQTDTRGNVIGRTTTRAMNGTAPVLFTEYYAYFLGAPGDPRNDLITAYRDARSASPTDDTYRTAYTYDAFGNLVTQRTPATADFPSGRTQSWTFTTGTETAVVGGGTVPRGLLASMTDPRGKIVTFGYDSKGDLRRDQDPVGLVHQYDYDELGRRLTAKEISDSFPSGLTTTNTYDKLSRLATTTEPGVLNPITNVTHTAVTTNTYDLDGNLTQTTVADSTGGDATRSTTYAYDDADHQTAMTVGAGSPLAATTTLTYDDNGNVATSTDPNGTVTAYTYTAKNLPATTTLKDFVDDPVAASTPRDVVLDSRAYDPAGRLASVTDAEGRTVIHTYWLDDLPRQEILQGYRPPDLATGTLSSSTARDIVLVNRAYDAAGQPVAVTGGGGLRKAETAFDAAGRVTTSTLAPGTVARTASYTYDANDNVTSTVFGAAGTSATERVDAAYDDASRPTSETVFGDGTATFVTSFQHDQRGFRTAGTDPRGYVAGGPPNAAYTNTVTVNAAGLIAQVKSPPVAVEEWGGSPSDVQQTVDTGYNTFGEVTQDRDARGMVTTSVHDVRGRVTQRSGQPYTPPGGSALTPTESWTYDAAGNPLTHTDRRGKITTTVYDKLNRPVAVTDPQIGTATAGVSRINYDDVGNVLSTVDQLGAWSFAAYDDLDRVWATTATERSPSATFTTYTDHNDAGDVTRVVTPVNTASGASQTAVYNDAGDLVESRDEGNNLTTYGHDLAGRLTAVTDPLGRATRTTYDRAGRAVRVAQFSPAGTELRAATIGYDTAGNPTSTTNALGWTTTATYDALGQTRSTVEPVDASYSITTTFGYAKGGVLTRATDGRGNRVVYTYNSLNLRESVIEPSTTAHPNTPDRGWMVSYDAGGLPVSESVPGGVTRTRTFDELGRMTAESGSGTGVTSATHTFGYDLAGQITTISHPQGSQNFTYNDRGLVTGGSGSGNTTTFTYDANGRMISRGDPGSYSAFGYNSRGDLNLVTGTATGGSRSLIYDAARQLTSINYGSGGATRTFGYDDLGRTTSDTLAGPGGTLRGQSYTYDAEDNELTTTVSPTTVAGAGTSTYTYDRADRLTSWTDPASTTTSYGWDPAGNRTAVNGVAATYDQRNRLLSDGTATYTYTPRGTLATRVAGATTATTEFDALDQLVSDSTAALTSYGYDGLGRLAVRNGTRLTYGGLEREPVVDGTSAYSRDPDGDIIAAGTSGGNWATLTNTHGDLVAAFPTNGSSLTDNRAYDPFGSPIVAGAANLRVGYQGSWTDPTTARVSAQARWYSPGTGSFASRDTADVPFTGAASANRYLYANANPLAYNDPTGYFSFGSVLSATASVARGDLGIAVVKAGAKAAAGAVVGAAATLTNPKRAFFGPVVYPIYQRLTKDDSPAARSDPVSSPVTTY
ncbi:DNRLRE domain-containing protein [Frankia gtarii]|uniref:DNRLRE domain-containing protein n=1 Tax=Frankia gtarii TaxID=2950102 RepID=UPI0021BF88F4|nr:DNRLRE domain-containing protein [Frankia gtarii]